MIPSSFINYRWVKFYMWLFTFSPIQYTQIKNLFEIDDLWFSSEIYFDFDLLLIQHDTDNDDHQYEKWTLDVEILLQFYHDFYNLSKTPISKSFWRTVCSTLVKKTLPWIIRKKYSEISLRRSVVLETDWYIGYSKIYLKRVSIKQPYLCFKTDRQKYL